MRLFSFIAILFCLTANGQNDEKVFSFAFWSAFDFTNNFNGGIKENKPSYLGYVDLIIDFDTRNAGLWKGGMLTAHLLNTHGATPSADNVGDWQAFSNIEAGNHFGVFELFYTQKLEHLTVKFGWNNMNSDFYLTEFGALFINSSFGISPVASLNVPASIFPVTSPFIYAGYTLNEKSLIKLATYAGDPGDIESNRYNLKWDLCKENGIMNILEYQYINNSNKYLGIKAGAYIHTAILRIYPIQHKRRKT